MIFTVKHTEPAQKQLNSLPKFCYTFFTLWTPLKLFQTPPYTFENSRKTL